MSSTDYVWSGDYDARIAVGFRADGSPCGVQRHVAPNAAYSVHTIPRDVAHLLAALIASRADRAILRPETIAAMLRPRVAVRPNTALAWALGFGLQRAADGLAIWHWGDNPGSRI